MQGPVTSFLLLNNYKMPITKFGKAKTVKRTLQSSDDDDEVLILDEASAATKPKSAKSAAKSTKPKPAVPGPSAAAAASTQPGPSSALSAESEPEFQDGQELPDWEYSAPLAPAPIERDIPNSKDVLLLAPRPISAYRLGFESKFLTLHARRTDLVAQLIEMTESGEHMVPQKDRKISLSAEQMAALEHYLPEFRGEMHDGGSLGEHKEHLGGMVFMSLNPDFGESLDIRQFFFPKGTTTPQATRRAVRLTIQEADDLAMLLAKVKNQWPAYRSIEKPCFLLHETSEETKECKSCSCQGQII